MFSTFPDGCPGAGLALLRLASGSILLFQGSALSGQTKQFDLPALMMIIVVISAGCSLLVGIFTRLVAALTIVVCLGGIFFWLPGPHIGPLAQRLTAALVASVAAALVCLGPGAFSLDARLFGRREIIIPSNSRSAD